jgi:hypothetical protein
MTGSRNAVSAGKSGFRSIGWTHEKIERSIDLPQLTKRGFGQGSFRENIPTRWANAFNYYIRCRGNRACRFKSGIVFLPRTSDASSYGSTYHQGGFGV